ncbi:DMT family transporter [Candidatus Dojkabacteria bacterium]|nr:DMT family transporter [Candidatus Dojkabacteria bacterium]
MTAGLLNLASFALPTIVLYLYVFGSGIEINVSAKQILIILFSAFFLSFLGNYFSMKGQHKAENPGFSLMIQKSYGVFTIFLAAILFDSEITLIKLVGTFVIVLFGLILSIEKGKPVFSRDNTWLLYTLAAFFCFGLLTTTSKYIFNEGLDVYVYMLFLYTFVSAFGLLQQIGDRANLKLNGKVMLVVLLIGIFSLLFNLSKNQAFVSAPNIGYVNAANAASIAALTVVSAILFKDKLTTRKMIGVLGIFIGLVMIFV